jgi:DNA gyrase/topoisomerase IV subunit A
MGKTNYTQAELDKMKLHLFEGLIKAKKEHENIIREFNTASSRKDVLIEKFNFSPVQANCILDIKVPLSELDEQQFEIIIKEIKEKYNL